MDDRKRDEKEKWTKYLYYWTIYSQFNSSNFVHFVSQDSSIRLGKQPTGLTTDVKLTFNWTLYIIACKSVSVLLEYFYFMRLIYGKGKLFLKRMNSVGLIIIAVIIMMTLLFSS